MSSYHFTAIYGSLRLAIFKQTKYAHSALDHVWAKRIGELADSSIKFNEGLWLRFSW